MCLWASLSPLSKGASLCRRQSYREIHGWLDIEDDDYGLDQLCLGHRQHSPHTSDSRNLSGDGAEKEKLEDQDGCCTAVSSSHDSHAPTVASLSSDTTLWGLMPALQRRRDRQWERGRREGRGREGSGGERTMNYILLDSYLLPCVIQLKSTGWAVDADTWLREL